MKLLSTSLAWKYLRFSQKDRSISFMIKICFLGIFIGTFSLMLTLIITNGFEKVIHEKMQGITSQVIIHAPNNMLDDTSIKKVLQTEFSHQIKATSSSSIKQVIIDRNKQQSVLFIKGIEPETEGLVSSIGKKIILPSNSKTILQKLLINNQILIGHKMAKTYNLSIGDKIKLLIPEPSRKSKKIFLNKSNAIIAGIFNVGLEEYDNNFAYTSLDFLKELFKKEHGVDQISLALNTKPASLISSVKTGSTWSTIKQILSINFLVKLFSRLFYFESKKEKEIISSLKNRLTGLTISSWKDLYPALVSSLKLEKYVMFLVLALITLVACMNMISLLFMQIQQKRRDIAIFKAMGMPHKNIKRIFLCIGLSITFFASIFGLGLAALTGYWLENNPIIKLPDVYYISYLPARMDPEIFIVVFLCTMLLGFLATWIPAKRTRKINIVEVLRQE